MSRLPTIGGDYDSWGTVLNDYLNESAGVAVLSASTIVGATSVSLAVVPSGLTVGSVVAIDAFTTECELRTVTSVTGSTVGFATATHYAHASGDTLLVLNDYGATPPMFGMTDGTADNWGPMQRLVLESLDTAVTARYTNALRGNVWNVSKPIGAPTSVAWNNLGLKTHSSYGPVDAAGALCMVSNRSWAFTASAATNVFTVAAGHGMSSFSATNHTKIMFNNPYGETLPGGITAGKVYYIDTVPNGTTFTVSATSGGSVLDVTADGTGWAWEGIEQLSRVYWDNVRFDVTVADVNGVRASLQQPAYISNLRIEHSPNCTVRTYGMVAQGQLAAITNAEINNQGSNTTGLSLGGSGITVLNLNQVGGGGAGGPATANYGTEVACAAGTITNFWHESYTIALKLTAESRAFAVDGTWLVSGCDTTIQVDADAIASSYKICPITRGFGEYHILHDIGRVIDLYTNGYTGDLSLVATDYQGTYMGHVQEGQNSADLGYRCPTLAYRSVVAKAADYTARYIDKVIHIDSTAASRTVTLPTCVGWAGIDITVGHWAGANTCTIDPVGAETINGASTYVVPANAAVTIVSNGTEWKITAVGLPGALQTYSASNVVTDRTYDANATTLDEVADVLGTLIADLRTRKIVA